MNTTIKLSVATALAFGAVAAHASIAVPSSGSSDAILFAEVLNSGGTVVASYAGDTGVSLSTLAAGLSGTQVVLGGTANLNALFAADVSGDTLEWAIQGGQYTGAANILNFGVKGAAQFVTTTTGNATSTLAGDNTGNLIKWAGLSNDVAAINANINGPATSIEGTSAAGAGVWDVNTTGGTEGWYRKAGPQTSNALGSTENLYYVTGKWHRFDGQGLIYQCRYRVSLIVGFDPDWSRVLLRPCHAPSRRCGCWAAAHRSGWQESRVSCKSKSLI